MMTNTLKNESLAQIKVRWVIASAVRHMTPINSEKRVRWLEFIQWFVDSAGTDDDPFGPEDGLTDNPNDRRAIVNFIGDVIGTHYEEYHENRDAWVRAVENTLYDDPKWYNDSITRVTRDVMVDSIVRRYIYALEGPAY